MVPADRSSNPIKGVVIADCRFKNEINLLRNAGGKLVRVIRSGAGLDGEAGKHQSESEQIGFSNNEFDIIIDNNGSLQELYQKVIDVYENLI